MNLCYFLSLVSLAALQISLCLSAAVPAGAITSEEHALLWKVLAC